MRKKIYVGIDLGTTYSAVGTFNKAKGTVEILKNGYDEDITPSVICIENGKVTIGADAKQAQKDGNVNTAAFYKSMMGDSSYSVYLDGKDYSAEDLSGLYLRELKKDIEQANDVEIAGAVITVPAYFSERQITATVNAGKFAGLNVMKIINEPTAAIISYGLTGGGRKNVMVYDLGGGTFDVTIAKVEGTNVNVISTNGNHQLGGKDWDGILHDEVCERFYDEFDVDIRNHPDTFKELQVKCEQLKKDLSNRPEATIAISCEGFTGRYEITREFFEENTKNFLNETLLLINKCFDEIGGGFSWRSLDEVALVGGSTRMPQVRDMILAEYGKEPVKKSVINVDTIVASGAAMQAELCVSNQFTLTKIESTPQGNRVISLTVSSSDIADITAHSLGILVYDPDADKLKNEINIPKNSKHGQVFNKEYYSRSDKLEIYVLQGESEDPEQATLLYSYEVTGLTKGQSQKIVFALKYNTNGLVDVEASLDGIKPLKVIKTECTLTVGQILAKIKANAEPDLPYTQYAGISNIPQTKKDQYGNPEGSDYDLIPDGALKGYKLLLVDFDYFGKSLAECQKMYYETTKALEKKGLKVDCLNQLPANFESRIYDYCQIWLIAGHDNRLTASDINAIIKYFNSGHGVYLWSDNDPFTTETNQILSKLFNTATVGDYIGQHDIGIRKNGSNVGIIEDHLITTGMVTFYEGNTISNITLSGGLKALAYSSDGKIVTAYYDQNDRRLLVDGGSTRLWDEYITRAGTARLIVNSAAWLANFEKFGYKKSGKPGNTLN